jgi:hypothetical protein
MCAKLSIDARVVFSVLVFVQYVLEQYKRPIYDIYGTMLMRDACVNALLTSSGL